MHDATTYCGFNINAITAKMYHITVIILRVSRSSRIFRTALLEAGFTPDDYYYDSEGKTDPNSLMLLQNGQVENGIILLTVLIILL